MANNSNTPTLKQRLFAKEYVKNKGNGVRAALQVYDPTDYNSAKTIATKNLQKPIVKQEIEKELKRAGLGLNTILDSAKTAMLSGLGVKAKNSDAISVINTLLKVYNVFPGSKHMRLNLSKSEQLPSKDILEIKVLLTDMNKKTSKLLEDLEK